MEAMGQIRKGMRVVGANGDEVGEVDDFKIGNQQAATPEGQTTTGADGLLQDLARGFGGGDSPLPDEQRERLLRLGYIKVDRTGLFKEDLYVAGDDIRRVSGDSVHLAFTPE